MGDDEIVADIRKELGRELDAIESEVNKWLLSYKECLNIYLDSMKKLFEEATTFLSQTDLETRHQNEKNQAIEKVWKIIVFFLFFSIICSDNLNIPSVVRDKRDR